MTIGATGSLSVSAGIGMMSGDSFPYGLAMRFQVSVDDCDLGHWSACKGLKAELKKIPVTEGGNYWYEHVLPDKISYQTITLERAVHPQDSPQLQTWLQNVAGQWMNYAPPDDDGGNPYTAGDAKITLLGAAGQEVMTWTLTGIYPVSWTGPSLSATENQVAIETLELAHQGFLDSPSLVRASLSDKDGNEVDFDFNPEQIDIAHASQQRPTGSAAHGSGPPKAAGAGGGNPLLHQGQTTTVGAITIAVNNLLFDGDETADKCNQLLLWSGPLTQGQATAAKLPQLTFQWGSPIIYNVIMPSVRISYVRFTSSGKPIRAKVTLQLQAVDDSPALTNPTSGGIPGRRSHTLVAGENLQHIAMANYGKPGAWRALAEANGIEDPLAVQPGLVVYLPAPEELGNGSPR